MTLKSVASSLLVRLLFGATAEESEYGRPVHWAEAGNRLVADTLASGGPCMITRLGSAELGAVSYYTRWRARRGARPPYPRSLKRLMFVNAGFFPADDESLDEFSRIHLEALPHADVMGVWFYPGERRIISEYCRQARLIEPCALYSMLYSEPWTAQLEGKRVLVVHPFAKTIESQYAERRAQLFSDPTVLPEFELKTLIPPQTIAGNNDGYRTWFDALDRICERIGRESYDLALIGAGAYGLPIAAFVKSEGRQAVHLGGATQLLFGIRGRRWEVESQDDIVPLFNQFWVRASSEETPEGASLVEGGCYW